MNRNEKMIALYGRPREREHCNNCAYCEGRKCSLAGNINPGWDACGKFKRKVRHDKRQR